MIRVMVVLGTRPEAVKMAPVIRALREHAGEISTSVCVTAQHRELLDQVLSLFAIRPEVDLDLMRPDQTPAALAGRVLLELEPVLRSERPDWVLVQGDTTTVMASALVAHLNHVRVGHVEAGLRSHDRANPFPEEMNRVIADHVSDLHFAPTEQARGNLLREGFSASTILVTGNTVIDALLQVAAQPWWPTDPALEEVSRDDRPVILVTAHRRENFGAPLADICTALAKLVERGDVQFVYPVHPNPGVRGPVYAALGELPGVRLVSPLSYRDMIWLMRRARLVLTDSGGLQEEAPAFGKPVLVMREVTERPEGVSAGTARLVGTDPNTIVAAVAELLDDPAAYGRMSRAVNPYGDGRAAARIVQALLTGSCEPFVPDSTPAVTQALQL